MNKIKSVMILMAQIAVFLVAAMIIVSFGIIHLLIDWTIKTKERLNEDHLDFKWL